jgi:hypothetical protein
MSKTKSIQACLAHARAWLADDAKVAKTAKFTFKNSDKDNSGYIEAGEVKGIFTELLKNSQLGLLVQMSSDYDLKKHFQKAETYKDQKMSLQEWTVFLKGFMTHQLAEDCACTDLEARAPTKDTSKTVRSGQFSLPALVPVSCSFDLCDRLVFNNNVRSARSWA